MSMHEKCMKILFDANTKICPQDRQDVDPKKWHKIYGHDILGMMKNIATVIKKYKNDSS